MQPFLYVHADSPDAAVAAGGREDARYIAGGTTLVDLMRLGVMRPKAVVDITGLALAAIEDAGGGLKIGALASKHRRRVPPAGHRAVPCAVRGAAVGRLTAAAQHGDGRRQPTRTARRSPRPGSIPTPARSGCRGSSPRTPRARS